MRTISSFLTVVISILSILVSSSVMAGNQTYVTKPANKLKPQTNCPVMGGVIDSTTYTDIQGQRVYHCCPMCSKKLKADPDKYFKQAAADGVLFENIQTNCPVSGEKLDADAKYLDFEGRRIYFCCNKCEKSFKADPQKYLKKMDVATDKTAEPMKEEHQGH